ncbi:unnamed protein product, partial [Musa textilis]
MFYKHTGNRKVSILIVYVDDISLIGDDLVEQEKLKAFLVKEFEIKNLGSLRYFLGMELARTKEISVLQRKYTLDLLMETGMWGCKPFETPINPNHKLSANTSSEVDKGQYQRMVGKLIYLSHIRPNIGFVVSVVNQFMNSPNEKHIRVVFRILQYFK